MQLGTLLVLGLDVVCIFGVLVNGISSMLGLPQGTKALRPFTKPPRLKFPAISHPCHCHICTYFTMLEDYFFLFTSLLLFRFLCGLLLEDVTGTERAK
jgi:hypothetical protein